MDLALLVGVGLLELAWLPILLRFVDSWRSRRNPVSLAIASTIGLVMFWTLSAFWLVMTEELDLRTVVVVEAGLSAVVCLNFYIAIRSADLRFADVRKKADGESATR
jgi:hypothetical protein